MSKIRSRSTQQIEEEISNSTMNWKELSDSSLLHYSIQEGVVHLIRIKHLDDIISLLSSFEFLMKRVSYGMKSITQLKLEYKQTSKQESTKQALQDWKDFISSSIHLLQLETQQWRAENILLQLGLEYPDVEIRRKASSWDQQYRTWAMLVRNNAPKRKVSPSLAVLSDHSDEISTGIQLSPTQCLSISRDDTLGIWNLITGSLEVRLEGHKHLISTAVLWKNLIYSFSWDKTVRIWTRGGELVKSKKISTEVIQHAMTVGEHFLVGSDQEMYICDDQFDDVTLLRSDVESDAFFPVTALDDTRFISWFNNEPLQIWSTQTKTCIKEIPAHEDQNIGGVIALTSQTFLSWVTPPDWILDRGHEPDDPQSMFVWNIDGTLLWEVEAHKTGISGIKKLSEDQVISWGWDGTVRLWDINNKTLVSSLNVDHPKVESLHVLSPSTFLFTSADSGMYPETMHKWTVQGNRHQSIRFSESIVTIEEHHDYLLVSIGDGKIVSVQTETFQQKGFYFGHMDTIYGIKSWDKSRFLSWSDDATLRFWDLETSCTEEHIELHSSTILETHLMGDSVISISKESIWKSSPTSEHPPLQLCTREESVQKQNIKGSLQWSDDTILLWSKSRLWFVNIHSEDVLFFQDEVDKIDTVKRFGNQIISGSEQGEIVLWNPESMSIQHQEKVHDCDILGLAPLDTEHFMSWSGKLWSTELLDETVRILTSDLKQKHILKGHRSWVNGACQQGNYIISWSRDIRVWTMQGEIVHVLEGDSMVENVRRYDQRLLSWNGSFWSDCMIYLWDLDTGKELLSFDGHEKGVKNAVLTDGNQMISWSEDAICVWSLENGERIEKWNLPREFANIPERIWTSGVIDSKSLSGKDFLSLRSSEQWFSDGSIQFKHRYKDEVTIAVSKNKLLSLEHRPIQSS